MKTGPGSLWRSGLGLGLAGMISPAPGRVLESLINHRRVVLAAVAMSIFLIALVVKRKYGQLLLVMLFTLLLAITWIAKLRARRSAHDPGWTAVLSAAARVKYPLREGHFQLEKLDPATTPKRLIDHQ